MTAPTISCGCEPLWPSGVDRSGCWWHSADSGSEAFGNQGRKRVLSESENGAQANLVRLVGNYSDGSKG